MQSLFCSGSLHQTAQAMELEKQVPLMAQIQRSRWAWAPLHSFNSLRESGVEPDT